VLSEKIDFALSAEDILICSIGRGKKRKYRMAEIYYFLLILVAESSFSVNPGERISGL
jgi:hypothetical protein